MTHTEAHVAGAWRGIGLSAEALADMLARYREPHRAYHNLSHVKSVLGMISEHTNPSSELIAAAILHDVIYDPRASDNEEQSAQYARRVLADSTLSPDRVAELILFTKGHDAPEDDTEAAALLDADLAVLAGYEQDYDSYAKAIRLEYWHVDPETYRAGRRQVLERLLARPYIFRLPENIWIFEQTARANLHRELNSLA